MSSTGPKRFDAFLSYNSLDLPVVRDVYERLQRGGLEPYLEREEVAPGDVFQRKLAEGLHASKSCVVFLGPNGLGPWQKEELQVAIDKRVRDEAFRVIPVLLPGADRPRRGDVAHLEFLINASWVEFLKTLDDERAFRSLVWGITGIKPHEPGEPYAEGVCPYRGLEPFRPEDARFFFGRENLTGWLVSALRREVRAAEGVRFLGVLGPSGSGKSSVVLAGLVPKLNAGGIEGSERWPVAILRPGDDPLKNLTEKVVPKGREVRPDPSLSELGEQEDLLSRLRAKGDDAAGVLDRYVGLKFANEPDDRQLVIVVDQFEEVFTYRPQDDQARARFEQGRDRFFSNLLHAAAAPGGRVAVVLTMRSDFLSACATFPQLAAVLSAHQDLVGPMTPAELREAIERPAFLVGCEVKPELTERLLADVEGQPGALPLLQFALTEVWKKRDVRRLTLRAYTDLGKDARGEPRGIEGVLDHRADAIYRSLSPEDQDLCRRLFLRLVQPGEGTKDTKRRVPYRELLPDDLVRADAIKRLIGTLAYRDSRLITTSGTKRSEKTEETAGTVEVVHESLIQGWARLRQWIDDKRGDLLYRRRLTEAATEWAATPEHKAEYLYTGVRLTLCREWVETHRDELNAIEAEFLCASEQAERQRKQAEAERAQIANSLRLASLSVAERDKRLDRSLLLAAEALHAFQAEPPFEARDALINALNTYPELRSFLHLECDDIHTLAFSPDGKTLAAGYGGIVPGCVGGVVLWDLEHQHLGKVSLDVNEGDVLSVAFSPDGKTLAAGYGDRQFGGSFAARFGGRGSSGVVLWDLQKRQRLGDEPLAVNEGSVLSVAFSPDGKTLAAGYRGGGVVLWDLQKRQRLGGKPLDVKNRYVTSVAFGPDGKILAAGYGRVVGEDTVGGVVLWDVEKRQRLRGKLLAVNEGEVSSVAFSPDGKTLAAGYGIFGRGSGVVVWDVDKRQRLGDEPLAVNEGSVLSAAFSPDGKTLAAAYQGGGVVLWNADQRRRLVHEPLNVTKCFISSVAFGRDGKTLAAGFGPLDHERAVGGVLLWDMEERQRLMHTLLVVNDVTLNSLSFSPDGKTLAAGYGIFGRGSGVVLWDVDKRQRLGDEPLAVNEGPVSSVAFSPDGKTLAAGYPTLGSGGGVVLWDVGKRQRLGDEPLTVEGGDVSSVAFSPDGKTLAAGCGSVVLWNMDHRQCRGVKPFTVEGGSVSSVAFSPDGKTLAAGYTRVGSGGGVVLWDVGKRQLLGIAPLGVNEGSISTVAFSPDGKTLAAGCGRSYVGRVVLWDVEMRQRLGDEPLAVNEGNVSSVAFSPDGKTLAAGYPTLGRGGGVLLWDVGKRQRLGGEPLTVKGSDVSSVAFSPDGKTLAAGYRRSNDGGVVLWDVDIESWLYRAKRIVNRNFTGSEWRQFFPGEPYRVTFDDLPVSADALSK
jgi:WD40 repeat protein